MKTTFPSSMTSTLSARRERVHQGADGTNAGLVVERTSISRDDLEPVVARIALTGSHRLGFHDDLGYCDTPLWCCGYMCPIDVPEAAEFEGLAAGVGVVVGRDRCRPPATLFEAAIAEMVGAAERTGAYAEDGHASVSGWVRAKANL
jgi:hypothetical protein